MDQWRGEVDVENGDEEDHVDCQPNQEEGDHPHFECQYQGGSAEQPGRVAMEERKIREETEIKTE